MRAQSIAIPLLVLFAAACRAGGSNLASPDDPIAEIQAWEDQRSLADGRLQRYVKAAPDVRVRARALLALARIQEAETADTIAAVLADPSPIVRDAAAFAAGELGLSWEPLPDAQKQLLTARVLEVEAQEPDEQVRVAHLDALGKLATPDAQARLIQRVGDAPPRLAARAALALAMAPRRGGAFPDAAFAPLLERAQGIFTAQAPAGPAEVRDDPAYALAYAIGVSKRPEALLTLRACSRAARSEVRALCAKGLGEVGQPEDVQRLGELLRDPDHRVVSEAVRALVKLAAPCGEGECPAETALASLGDKVDLIVAGNRAEGGQPLLAFAQAWSHPRGGALLATIRQRVRSALLSRPDHAWDLARLDCRLAAAQVRERGSVDELRTCGDASVPEWWRIALGLAPLAESKTADPGRRLETISAYLEDPRPAVRSAALGALASLKAREMAERIRPLILDDDPYVAVNAAVAAAAIGDAEAVPQIHALALRVPELPDLSNPIAEALVTLQDPKVRELLARWIALPHAHVRHVAAKWLTQVDGAPVHSEPVARSGPGARPSLSGDRYLTIRTRGGDLRIRLLLEDAPLTAQNLYDLAKRGYFKDLTFHRVVPNFVVQGGDPHGDGEGGPGYTLRCEINRRPYQRGTVGMALSGKDTGGSQFFVATSPQPHLDGRYTVFGEVVAGLELADGLLEGEPILDLVAE